MTTNFMPSSMPVTISPISSVSSFGFYSEPFFEGSDFRRQRRRRRRRHGDGSHHTSSGRERSSEDALSLRSSSPAESSASHKKHHHHHHNHHHHHCRSHSHHSHKSHHSRGASGADGSPNHPQRAMSPSSSHEGERSSYQGERVSSPPRVSGESTHRSEHKQSASHDHRHHHHNHRHHHHHRSGADRPTDEVRGRTSREPGNRPRSRASRELMRSASTRPPQASAHTARRASHGGPWVTKKKSSWSCFG